MSFKDYNKEKAAKIEKQLTDFLNEFTTSVKRDFPKIANLSEAFNNSVFGGKMIRGTLVYLGYDLTESTPNPDIVKPASAVEIIHTGLLVQDDVMDQSTMRRGEPSLYMQIGGNHYGISQTISLGDLGLFLGQELIAQANFKPDILSKALLTEAKTITKTALGQILDLYLPVATEQVNEEDILLVAETKSGYYSVTSPLLLGATFGEADGELLEKLKLFGHNLGVGFQIQDDILGIFGDEKTVGKSIVSDITEGKQTILYLYAKSHANNTQIEQLDKIYGRKNVSEKDAEIVRDIFEKTGALLYAKEKAKNYAEKAIAIIPQITRSNEYQTLLKELAELLVAREK